MAASKFKYSEKELRDCAPLIDSLTAAATTFATSATLDTTPTFATTSRPEQWQACISLYNRYCAHFGRDATNAYQVAVVPVEENAESVALSEGLYNFLRSVAFVVTHNENDNNMMHKVELNRFSDRAPADVLPIAAIDDTAAAAAATIPLSTRRLSADPSMHRAIQDTDTNDAADTNDDADTNDAADDESVTYNLTSADAILQAAELLAIGKGSINKFKPSKHHHHHHHNKNKWQNDDFYINSTSKHILQNLRVPISLDRDPFDVPESQLPNAGGSIYSIQQNRNAVEGSGSDAAVVSGAITYLGPSAYNFDVHLDWATTVNPDGVRIVHPAVDQGTCGSCWALAATGSLEASASRHAAHKAYVNLTTTWEQQLQQQSQPQLSRNNGKSYNSTVTDNIKREAVQRAIQVENEAFNQLNLSIQELLDCDTYANQGCTGGNPLLAFYYIYRHGLTSWESYPYMEAVDRKCVKHSVHRPIATVKSWGVISPNHQKHIKLVLRYIGPVAVGFNGASQSFLSYSGGIFDERSCRTAANHALLITGYGEEVVNGKLRHYWIARNSWGTEWGENGYVRIRRHHSNRHPGVCGIARSPSVALGGKLLLAHDFYANNTLIFPGATNINENTNDVDVEAVVNDSYFPWAQRHKAQSLGLLGILCALCAIYPLSSGCRRRRRMRILREKKKRTQASAATALAGNGRCGKTDETGNMGETPTSSGEGSSDEMYHEASEILSIQSDTAREVANNDADADANANADEETALLPSNTKQQGYN